MEEREYYYFTFGQSHVCEIDGVKLDANCVLKVPGTYSEARDRVFDLIGDRWCFQYDEEEIEDRMHRFPRGIVEVPSI